MTESRKTVLVVDDEDVICETLESVLSGEYGYTVLVANSSSDAGKQIQNYPSIEYVIIDLQLKDSSSYGDFGGIALFLHIAEAHPSAKRIIYSGFSFEKVRNQIRAFNPYLQKEIENSFVQKDGNFDSELAEILKRFHCWWGSYHALLIAVQDYEYHPCTPNLQFPIHDIQRLKTVLIERYVFEPDKIYTLINPTRRDIVRKLFELADELGSTDNLLIFYAGHGHKDSKNEERGYWMPRDACYVFPSNPKCETSNVVAEQKEPENTPETWLSHADVRDWVARIKTKHTLLITDSCYGGTFANLRRGNIENLPPEEQYKYPSKRFMSSGNSHESVDDKSSFLESLLDCLKQTPEHLSAYTIYEFIREKKLKTTPLYEELAGSGESDENGHFIFIRR